MASQWGGRLRLIPTLNFETRTYDLKEFPIELPMPRYGSRVYSVGENWFASGKEEGIEYLDILCSSNSGHEWALFKDNDDNKKIEEDPKFEGAD